MAPRPPADSRATHDLRRLQRALDACATDVGDLQAMTRQEANPMQLVDLNLTVSQQIDDIRRRYCKVLRRQVANEMFKMQGLLEELQKYEASDDWTARGHKPLYAAVRQYNDLHFNPAGPAALSLTLERPQSHSQTARPGHSLAMDAYGPEGSRGGRGGTILW